MSFLTDIKYGAQFKKIAPNISSHKWEIFTITNPVGEFHNNQIADKIIVLCDSDGKNFHLTVGELVEYYVPLKLKLIDLKNWIKPGAIASSGRKIRFWDEKYVYYDYDSGFPFKEYINYDRISYLLSANCKTFTDLQWQPHKNKCSCLNG
jgi:hypothetical protein